MSKFTPSRPRVETRTIYGTSDSAVFVDPSIASKHQALINLREFLDYYIGFEASASEVHKILDDHWDEFKECLDTEIDPAIEIKPAKSPNHLKDLIRTNEEEQRGEFVHASNCPLMMDISRGRSKHRKCTCPQEG